MTKIGYIKIAFFHILLIYWKKLFLLRAQLFYWVHFLTRKRNDSVNKCYNTYQKSENTKTSFKDQFFNPPREIRLQECEHAGSSVCHAEEGVFATHVLQSAWHTLMRLDWISLDYLGVHSKPMNWPV